MYKYIYVTTFNLEKNSYSHYSVEKQVKGYCINLFTADSNYQLINSTECATPCNISKVLVIIHTWVIYIQVSLKIR